MHRRKLLCAVGAAICALSLSREAPAVPLPLPDHARYAIEHFGERFGLGAATVISLAQDRQGFLWIGTEGGLFRYDGGAVKHFGRGDGLPGELVELVLAAPDQHLYVRTRKGISRLQDEKFADISLPEGAGELREVNQSFAVDSAGTLFVATQRGLLQIDSEGRTHLFGASDGLGRVDAIVRASDDTVWIASDRRLVCLARGSGKPREFLSLTLGDDHVVALVPAPENKLWIRSGHHIGILDTRRAASEPTWLDQGVPGANSLGVPTLDRHGNLLLPTCRGLYQRVGNEWRIIDHQSGLTSNAVASVLEDREGGIWVGTAGAGLDHWPGSKQWSGWTDAEGLPDALVLGVVRDKRSRIWVATNTALTIWDPGTRRWQNWAANGLAGSGARQLLLAPDGAVWALFPGRGIYRFDTASPRPQAQQVPTAPWQPHRIAVAPDGVIWGDGSGAFHTVQYEYGHFFVHEQAVAPSEAGTTETVSVSADGALWTAGSKGVSRWAKGKWRHFGTAAGLLNNDAKTVRAISETEAWVGYPDEGAITRLQISPSGEVTATQFQKGVCSMGRDGKGNTWLEMEEGAGLVTPNGHLTSFTQSDGLLWNDLNCDAMWLESDGTILLGTSKGLARYNPGQELPSFPQPTVVLTAALFGRLDRISQHDPGIPYKDRTFRASFAAPVLHDPNHVACRYRLCGLESEFTDTTLREVRYSSLPVGSYTFEVSCGSDAIGWSELAAYPFQIRPPWWRTWWSEICAMFLLVLVTRKIVQYRTRRDRQAREVLELAVAERSQDLAKLNRDLEEASLSDPLTGIRNRRFFSSTIAADASQAVRAYRADSPNYSRDHRDLIFYLIDVDHFKEVNDRYGHQAGDRLLIEISRRLGKMVRESDFLIRWGGEEFMVVCRAAEREHAPRMAERILSAVGSIEFDLGNGCIVRKTCSIGWAPFPWLPPTHAVLSVDDVLRLADQGLYLSKQRGRNQSTGILAFADVPAELHFHGFEELMKAGIIREVRTAGPAIAAAASAIGD